MKNNRYSNHSWRNMNIITSCISTTLMLMLLGTVVFFVTFAHKFSNSIKENFTVTLILDDDIPNKELQRLQKDYSELPCTRHLEYISKEEALKEQVAALGTDPSEFLGSNPMPASFELGLKAEYANHDSLKLTIPIFEKEKYVIDVSYPESLMDSLNDNIKKISIVLLIVALLLTLVSFELINNTIRLSVFSKRFLIMTMKLVGAKWSFIRKPFLSQAVWIGILSAFLASVMLGCGVYALLRYEEQMLNLISWDVMLITISTMFLCGIILTLLSAYFAVNSSLKMNIRKLYRG